MPPEPGSLLFLTGATSHAGALLARRLIREGWRLRVLSRSRERVARHLAGAGPIDVVIGDLERPPLPPAAMAGCAALVSVSHARFAPVLIDAARATGTRRAVFVSSARRHTRFPERTARGVIEGEAAIAASGLDYTILRPTMIFGGDRDNNLSRVIGWLRRAPVIPVPGAGLTLWQPTYVEDLVDALVATLRRDATTGQAYDLGGPEALTSRALLRAIADALGRRPPLLPLPLAPLFPLAALMERFSRRPLLRRDQLRRLREDKVVDISTARRDLDYHPTPFAEAIRRQIAEMAAPGQSEPD